MLALRIEEPSCLTIFERNGWLLSREASFLTGATIPVDGGRLAGGG